MRFSKHLILPAIGVLLIIAGGVGLLFRNNLQLNMPVVNSFEECVKAGNIVEESWPRRCRTTDGRLFTEKINSPEPITVRGTFDCLPHKNTAGSQTMECAFGLRDDQGVYYAVKYIDPHKNNSFEAGSYVEVTGMFIPRDDSKYQDIGIIEVESITSL